jgi:hypothetical protein
MNGGYRALLLGAILAVAVQALLLRARVRAANRAPREKRRFGPNIESHPAFIAAAFALVIQSITITLAILIHAQPVHFYLTLGNSGYSLAMLPSYLAWFILPAFRKQPELQPSLMLEAESA